MIEIDAVLAEEESSWHVGSGRSIMTAELAMAGSAKDLGIRQHSERNGE